MRVSWTEAMDEILRISLKEGLSYREVAIEVSKLGQQVSRNSCISRARRIDAAPKRKELTPLEQRRQRNGKRLVRKIVRKDKKRLDKPKRKFSPDVKRLSYPAAKEDVMAVGERALLGAARAVIVLDERQCRWPIGGVSEPLRFCSYPRDGIHSYCRFHRQLSRGRLEEDGKLFAVDAPAG